MVGLGHMQFGRQVFQQLLCSYFSVVHMLQASQCHTDSTFDFVGLCRVEPVEPSDPEGLRWCPMVPLCHLWEISGHLWSPGDFWRWA